MPRVIWNGSISFGLVNIPVRMFVAVRDHDVRFHLLHARDGVRVHQKLFCPADGEELDHEDTVRGYETSPDTYVVVHQDELDALAPKASRNIEILDFVDIAEIDPVYYQHPYYLLPEERSAGPYALLVQALEDSGRVGIGKLVMRNKEYLAALRPVDGVICLETMRFADEVMPTGEMEKFELDREPTKRELSMAMQLIDTLSSSFDPEKYHDEYREAVMELIESKAEGQEVTMPEAFVEPGKVVDLMSALEESLARAREKKERAG
jgi:DNA end-binding protein Ku